jgi:hypothetical protein
LSVSLCFFCFQLKPTRLKPFLWECIKTYLAGAILFLIDLLIPCSTLKRRAKFFLKLIFGCIETAIALLLFMKSYLDIRNSERVLGKVLSLARQLRQPSKAEMKLPFEKSTVPIKSSNKKNFHLLHLTNHLTHYK